MSYLVQEKEIAAVTKLAATERYAYFIGKVVDFEELWSLRDSGGWALAADNSGKELVPVWPAAAFASLCATGIWSTFIPQAISLQDWLTKWIVGMERDGRAVIVFPSASDGGICRAPNELQQDLQLALSDYE